MTPKQLELITQYAKDCLRAEFDEASNHEAAAIIDKAKEMGLDEFAADMQKDLDFEIKCQKDTERDYNNGIKAGCILD